jgi:cyclin B
MIPFIGQVALVDYRMTTIYYPSMVTASAAYAARCTLRKSSLSIETLEYHTGLHEQQFM